MDVIAQVRELGKAIQQDERYINYAKAKLANDNDENLQKISANLILSECSWIMSLVPKKEMRIKSKSLMNSFV